MRLDSGVNVPDDGYVKILLNDEKLEVLVYRDGTKKFRHIRKCYACGHAETEKTTNLTWSMNEEIVSLDPFVVEQAIGCDVCGLDGYIRNGKWYDRVETDKALVDYEA